MRFLLIFLAIAYLSFLGYAYLQRPEKIDYEQWKEDIDNHRLYDSINPQRDTDEPW